MATTVAPEQEEDQAVGVLIDLTRCTGCESCVLACKAANDLADPDTPGKSLDCDNLTVVQTPAAETAAGEAATVHVKRQCMHCLHPACVSACTVGALRKTDHGPVVYDGSKCIGCRYCQYACPFGVPAYDWDNPLGLIAKCQLCTSRLNQGLRPACVGACPNGALRYGKRHELLAQARGQIASNPDRYVAHIYGEHEAGGTSVLYLSPVPFAALGFPQLEGEPAPRYAEWVMQRTPVTALTVAALATALHWITRHPAPEAITLPAGSDEGSKGDTP
jgi:formate dehydrogenase iron-sulfur subunit